MDGYRHADLRSTPFELRKGVACGVYTGVRSAALQLIEIAASTARKVDDTTRAKPQPQYTKAVLDQFSLATVVRAAQGHAFHRCMTGDLVVMLYRGHQVYKEVTRLQNVPRARPHGL